MNEETQHTKNHVLLTHEEQSAIEYVKDIKGFYSHLTTYLCVIAALAAINFMMSPNDIWFIWTALAWGVGIIAHGLSVFEVINILNPDWEKRQIEKRLGRKL